MDRATRFDLANFGELIGDASRAAMLVSLQDGELRPATELARIADVSASTASAHLARLVSGGLLACTRAGRHRYYRLADDRIAQLLEAIAAPTKRRNVDAALARARTCYRHLAGELGVQWFRALERKCLVHPNGGEIELTPRGIAYFEKQGCDAAHLKGRLCLDWTERHHHLGGPLGMALTAHLLRKRYLARVRDSRALRVTAAGARYFEAATR